MRPRQPKSWIILIALCSALVYVALQYSPRDLMGPDTEDSQARYPETYIEGMSDRAYADTGTLRHTLNAERVIYYTEQGQTKGFVEQPHLVFFAQSDSPPWHLRAERGVADTQRNTLTLKNNVTAYSDHPEFGRITVDTDDLLIDTVRQFAQTDKPVTMRSARGITSAVGLNAELESGRVELLSEVQGIYEPQ